MILGITYTNIYGTNGNVPYPILQTCGTNLYYYQPLDRSDSPSPGAANLQSQVAARQGLDTNSIYADPLFNRQHPWWDARYTDYGLQPNSPALGLGFQQTDTSRIGLQAGFPFNVTNILGQSVSQIRFAADYSRLLKVHSSGNQIQPIRGSSLPAGSWVRYDNFDFATGQYEEFRVHLQYVASPQNKGTAIEIHLEPVLNFSGKSMTS
jgi:hypothetical protein